VWYSAQYYYGCHSDTSKWHSGVTLVFNVIFDRVILGMVILLTFLSECHSVKSHFLGGILPDIIIPCVIYFSVILLNVAELLIQNKIDIIITHPD